MKRFAAFSCAIAMLMLLVTDGRLLRAEPGKSPEGAKPTTAPSTQPVALKIDLDKSVAVDVTHVNSDLMPQDFKTTDGRSGWALKIPGGRPIATPAYADGLLFVGGGYGSHEFYAFDAQTGKKVWQMQTGDDGPTAAVVEDGYVAFNTESCTVIVAEAKTGKLVWQEWLGDPLMSQPAIAKGKLYIAYPGGNPRGPNHGAAAPGADPVQAAGAQQLNNAAAQPAAPAQVPGGARGNGHRLLCADLKTGKHIWEQDITGDVMSAPIVEGDQVFFTCFDGTSFALNCADGKIVWQKHNSGTSAPLVAGGQVIVAQRQNEGKDVMEGVRRLDVNKGEASDRQALALGKAEYLKEGHAGNVTLQPAAQKLADSSVGFGAAPATAQLQAATANANVSTVVGGWSYQGSRAAFANGNILNAQANRLNCIRSKDGQVAWQAEATGQGVTAQVQAFSPPAIAGGNLFVCSSQGHLLCLDQKSGKVGFLYATNEPMAFQPALAGGNVYAGTANGMLICLKTGDATVDGWTAWGGNAQHNRKD